MGKYRRKPVIVKAIQWDGSPETLKEINKEWGDRVSGNPWRRLEFANREAIVAVFIGDWIVQDEQGLNRVYEGKFFQMYSPEIKVRCNDGHI